MYICKSLVPHQYLFPLFPEKPSCFHRTLFLFVCRDPACSKTDDSSNFLAFRSQLPRTNPFYSFDPPDYDTKKVDVTKFHNASEYQVLPQLLVQCKSGLSMQAYWWFQTFKAKTFSKRTIIPLVFMRGLWLLRNEELQRMSEAQLLFQGASKGRLDARCAQRYEWLCAYTTATIYNCKYTEVLWCSQLHRNAFALFSIPIRGLQKRVRVVI